VTAHRYYWAHTQTSCNANCCSHENISNIIPCKYGSNNHNPLFTSEHIIDCSTIMVQNNHNDSSVDYWLLEIKLPCGVAYLKVIGTRVQKRNFKEISSPSSFSHGEVASTTIWYSMKAVNNKVYSTKWNVISRILNIWTLDRKNI